MAWSLRLEAPSRLRGESDGEALPLVHVLLTVCVGVPKRGLANVAASRGEVLSFRHARASGNGISWSITDIVTTLSGHRHRAVPFTQPMPMPCDTRPEWSLRSGKLVLTVHCQPSRIAIRLKRPFMIPNGPPSLRGPARSRSRPFQAPRHANGSHGVGTPL